ncbi:hypothetical protein P4S83_00215 [Aneurinibacillus thermoaerophilus]|uniref:hypothetical protein n=1 Tax=Aneurinibacillus thermoaerophilus TaxID=143495 RepID=UPI002E204049|nr:hypothetical protein [Aneurinibacillus thermoaerophilus]MED0766120.1 hypothetical protein [Aneurinibacillus thermoaerophilus]
MELNEKRGEFKVIVNPNKKKNSFMAQMNPPSKKENLLQIEALEQQTKYISQNPPEYITMIVENLNQLNEAIEEIASGLHGSSNGGGGGGMDDLKRRVNDLDNKMSKIEEKFYTLDKTLALVEERTKKIDSLPTEDRLKSII